MKRKRYGFFFSLLLVLLTVGARPAVARVYIDVTSPGLRKLPIAVQSFTGRKEVSEVVKNDLAFTGLFEPIEEAAQIERPEQPFTPANWQGLGVELVVKGVVTAPGADRITALVSAYDVVEGREVFRKEYTASADILRQVGHSIANDIYALLTGQPGVFKTKIVFVGEKGGTREFYLMDWDGYRMQGLGITGGILLAPRWSPDRSKLLYSAERHRQWGIYLLDLNTMKERSLLSLNGLNMAGGFFPDSREFLYSSSREGNPNIYLGDTGGAAGRKIISSPWIDVSPSVSMDGSSLLFVSNRSGSPQIYLSDRDGYGVRRLTFEGNYNTSPAWSPRGDRIAFVSRVGGKHQIFTIKPDGSGMLQLTSSGNNEDPAFSPDGRSLTFTSDRDGSKGVYLMRANGEGQVRITPKGLKAGSSSWSP
ncbi:MAG: Tol-Pal system beta propeller repeat protein TolB, partial [Thermodesulfovibrionales bacterium]